MVEYAGSAPESEVLSGLFAIPQDEIARAYPSAQAGVVLMENSAHDIATARENARYRPGEDAADSDEASRLTRRRRREIQSGFNISALETILWTGAQYAATSNDPEEGEQALKRILHEELGPSAEDFFFIIEPVMGQVPYVQNLRKLGKQAATEIEATRVADDAANYFLLKALATNIGAEIWDKNRKAPAQDWRASHLLARLAILGGLDLQPQLTSELHAGKFDSLIATDLLRGTDGEQPLSPSLARLRRLSNFSIAVAGAETVDKEAFRNNLVSLLDKWPLGEQRIVTNAREILHGGLTSNFALSAQRLKEIYFTGGTDLETVFKDSVWNFLGGLIRSVQLGNLPPKDKVEMAALKAKLKNRNNSKGPSPKDHAEVDESPEETKEPPTLVTCNLANDTITEGIEALAEGFVEDAAQGPVVGTDVERMIKFMVRIDLPPNHRRGIKIIKGTGIRFQDKIHRLWEFKPLDAAGLSLQTNVAKNARIYFIKLPDNTLGIVGIQPRSEQEKFLRGIRTKIKPGTQTAEE